MLMPKRWRDRTTVRAVHDDDIENLLRDLGIFDDVLEGKLTCDVCDEQVTLAKVGAIFVRDGVVRIACTNEDCCAVAFAQKGR